MLAILQTTGTVPCDKLREAIPATDRLNDPDSVGFNPSGAFLNYPGAGAGYKDGLEGAGGYGWLGDMSMTADGAFELNCANSAGDLNAGSEAAGGGWGMCYSEIGGGGTNWAFFGLTPQWMNENMTSIRCSNRPPALPRPSPARAPSPCRSSPLPPRRRRMNYYCGNTCWESVHEKDCTDLDAAMEAQDPTTCFDKLDLLGAPRPAAARPHLTLPSRPLSSHPPNAQAATSATRT